MTVETIHFVPKDVYFDTSKGKRNSPQYRLKELGYIQRRKPECYCKIEGLGERPDTVKLRLFSPPPISSTISVRLPAQITQIPNSSR